MNKRGFEYRGIHTRVYNLVKNIELDFGKHMKYLMNTYDISLEEAKSIYFSDKEKDLQEKPVGVILREIKKKDEESNIALAGLFGTLAGMSYKAKRGGI